MSCLRAGFGVYGSSSVLPKNRTRGGFRVSFETLQIKEDSPAKSFLLTDHLSVYSPPVVTEQKPLSLGRSLKWWEKSPQPNMIEIQSAQHLVDSLLRFGDRLVVLDFYSPGCGGCKTLYPKICQLAEFNPDTVFLKVNYDEHKPMCYALNVHVLPFFRLYRGADGKVCSFSCTNATIKKFKDALAKHSPKTSLIGPAKGLEDSEITALAAIGLRCQVVMRL